MQSPHSLANASEHLTFIDRLESLKAGSLSSLTSVLAFFAIAVIHHFVHQNFFQLPLISSFELSHPFILLIKLGMIGFSGFLFGVTYRYIVRRDRNSHLKSGAILAFAFIHSFGVIDHDLSRLTLLPLAQMVLAIAILLLENVAWIAIVQSILETAMQHQWISTFSSKQD